MLTIATVAMNRTEHLIESARAVSQLDLHSEHIIIDYGSSIPISREQFPCDDRIKLHRVENPSNKWWLTHSYNLAFALAEGDYILKLDADIILSQRFSERLLRHLEETKAHLMCNRLTLQDWSLPSDLYTSNGFFLCKRVSLEQVGGFNPYIQGWGWDEIDLYSRLFLAGFPVSRIPQDGLNVIQHDDDKREMPLPKVDQHLASNWEWVYRQVGSRKLMMVHNEKNRQIAVSSINKRISWPTPGDYRKAYMNASTLPDLPRVKLFEKNEKCSLLLGLARQLISPTGPKEAWYRILRKIGRGPYTLTNAQGLLDTCGIDTSLVS